MPAALFGFLKVGGQVDFVAPRENFSAASFVRLATVRSVEVD
jgi:hypothetical protein